MNTVDAVPPAPRWSAWWRLMRFDRPIGILLLLWPALWALWVAAAGMPGYRNLAIFITGVVLMRAAGCVANDIADRRFDPHVTRTRTRPLAAGEIPVRAALALLVLLLCAAFALVLLTNSLTIQLAFAGAALALSYPYFKRFTHLPQVVLGVAFGWSIPMAFAAETGAVPAAAWWLFAINLVWVVIYDTLYAMVDREDDLAIGVKSTAILFGRYDLLVLRLLMLVMLGGLCLFGLSMGWGGVAGAVYFGAVFLCAGLFWHMQHLARTREPAACFRAFLANHRIGLVVFLGLAGQYLFD